MRRMLLGLAFCLLSMTTAFAEESFFTERNGVAYFCGDENYPVWSLGRRVGAVADLSSAYISDEGERWRQIEFISFPVVLRGQGALDGAVPLETEARTCRFWQKITTGEFFFDRDGSAGNKVEGRAFTRELTAYGLLLAAAERNMADK